MVLKDFWREKKKNLLGTLCLLGCLIAAKLGFFGNLEGIRFAAYIDFGIWVLAPLAFIWDWLDFKKKR